MRVRVRVRIRATLTCQPWKKVLPESIVLKRAQPKSQILTRPPSSSMRFCVLRLRWSTGAWEI